MIAGRDSEIVLKIMLPTKSSCRPVIISALWQYIKTHKLQDQHEKEFVNCDPFLKQIFQVTKFFLRPSTV